MRDFRSPPPLLAISLGLALAVLCGSVAGAGPGQRRNPRAIGASGHSSEDPDGPFTTKLKDIAADVCAFKGGLLTIRPNGSGRLRGHLLQTAGNHAGAIGLTATTGEHQLHLIEVIGPHMSDKTQPPGYPVDATFTFDKSQLDASSSVDVQLTCRPVK